MTSIRPFTFIAALVVAVVVAVLLAGCGGHSHKQQNAYQFCQPHGGVIESTWEPNGNVTCFDGSYYDGSVGLQFAGFWLHHHRNLRPRYNPFAVNRARANAVRRYRVNHPQAHPVRRTVVVQQQRKSSSSSGGSSSRPSRSSSSGRRK